MPVGRPHANLASPEAQRPNIKLLFENWRRYLNENEEIWYHGGKIKGSLRSIYLTGDEALASMHGGKLYSFKVSPDARWMDLSDSEFEVGPVAMISMDSIRPAQIQMVREAGYDVVFDKEDFQRGYEQIFVANPEVLIPVGEVV